jgi:glucosylceramidase
MYWNMILDETGKSRWGWKQNSLVTIHRPSGRIVFNPEYYLFKHLTHFVTPGARWIPVKGSRKEVMAFRNPDGLVTVLFYNNSNQDTQVVVNTPRGNFKVVLQPDSFNTFSYEHASP